MITPTKKREWARDLENYAKYSNCRSRKLACAILDADGMLIALEHNRTANPVCINIECFKRMLGEPSGHSKNCKAVHAEEGASNIVKNYEIRQGGTLSIMKRPFVAIMNCGYPCESCLEKLFSVGVRHLILKNNTFYSDADHEAWTKGYNKLMTAEVCDGKV
jgi:deoxycytidylate deaminase